MQFKVLIVLAVIGAASAQRGHYSGLGPILGQRYQNVASNPQPSSNSIQQQASPAQAPPVQAPSVQPLPARAPPVQSNFIAPAPQPVDNRFQGPNHNYYNQFPQQHGPFGFGSYPFIGPQIPHGNFNNGFYGRR